MAWTFPVSLIAGGASVIRTFTTNALIGDLWTLLGSPSGPQDVSITVDGCDIGNVIISASWTAGSTFQFTCINGGRILGLGGNGGAGGNDTGPNGSLGFAGTVGGPAISSAGFLVSVDIDNGYLLGGGGGGGGGSYENLGATGNPGNGGGGGAGYSATTGGAAGAPSGVPLGIAGNAGGPSGGGTGGFSVLDPDSPTNGGDGGEWGAGGKTGSASDMMQSSAPYYHGGQGGRGGSAFYPTVGGTIAFNGAKSEATLRTEERLLGETASLINFVAFLNTDVSEIGISTHGYYFDTDGRLYRVNSVSGNVALSGYWYGAAPVTDIGLGYQVRVRNTTGSDDTAGTWTTAAAAAGTWVTINSARQWSITSSAGIETAGSLFEIRRLDAPTGDIAHSGYMAVTDENGV